MTPESLGIHGNHKRLATTLPSSSLLLTIAGAIQISSILQQVLRKKFYLAQEKEFMHPQERYMFLQGQLYIFPYGVCLTEYSVSLISVTKASS